MKSVEFLITISIILIAFSLFFKSYSEISDAALEKLNEFNQSIKIYHTRSLIESLRIFGNPFDYSGELSTQYLNVVDGLPSVTFNIISGKYEYLTCRRL